MTTEEYNQAVDNHADSVYRFIAKNLRDKEFARDIVQESYARLWENVAKIDGDKAKAYLFATAYHAMIDHLRRKKRLDFRETLPDTTFTDPGPNPDLQRILHQAIEKLPAAQRSVIMLRDYEGYSYQEIGEITGLSESQVKVYIFRGRVFLKKYIGSVANLV